jgi:hypothetical protein
VRAARAAKDLQLQEIGTQQRKRLIDGEIRR